MAPRYVIRPDGKGYSIVDSRTGAAVVIATLAQKGLSQADAEHTAKLLNGRPGAPPPAAS